MYFQTAALIAATITSAVSAPIEQRATGSTANEFVDGGCKPVMFAFARGSTEIGNMGTVVGPPTSDGLKATFGADQVATQGIDYAAGIATNLLPNNADPKGVATMKAILTQMNAQCPQSVVVAGGYSQGAAVAHAAISDLPANVQGQIAGVVTYGDTRKVQDNSQIPNFPKDKVDIICQPGDLVCDGTLVITAAHLTYGVRASEGAAYLSSKVKAVQAKLKAKRMAEIFDEFADALDRPFL